MDAFLHWFWSAIFLGLGILLLFRGGRITSVRRAFCFKAFEPVAQPDWDARVESAIERRQQAEGAPPPIGWYTGSAGVLIALACAFTRVPIGVLYAMLCLIIVLATASAFRQLRNTQQKRVAVLSSRTPDKVVPPYWFGLAGISAASILPLAQGLSLTLATVAVCISTLVTAWVAWRLTMLGAILSGDDIPAEQYVDDRVRRYRCSTVLILALIQPFVFASQMPNRLAGGGWAIYGATFVILIAFVVTHLLSRRRALA